jgi:RpoD_Cterm: RNA polymerase sigma factor RpoD
LKRCLRVKLASSRCATVWRTASRRRWMISDVCMAWRANVSAKSNRRPCPSCAIRPVRRRCATSWTS